MIKKKKIAGIAVASVMALTLCISITSVFASNNDGLKTNDAAKATKAQILKEDDKRVQTHDDLVAIATELGIKTDGMTDEQIKAALTDYKKSHIKNTEPDRFSPHEQLIAIAAKVGINTDGMTDEQIEAALTSYKLSHAKEPATTEDLKELAKKMGINSTGMSDGQIKATLIEKGKLQ